MKLALTTEQIERLQNGESVEVIVPGLLNAGQNTPVTIERGRDTEIAEYANVYHSEEGN